MTDEELLKQVFEEMGIEYKAGYITIDNVPASEWLNFITYLRHNFL